MSIKPLTSNFSIQEARNTDVVINELQDLIKSGQLSHGDKLPSERSLMARFQVGRHAVREAISVLARDGYLEVKTRHRPIITYIPQEAVFDIVGSLIQHFLKEKDGYEQLFKSRTFIEASLVRHAALYARKEDIQTLRAALEENKAAIGNTVQFYLTDIKFHKVLYDIPRNPLFSMLHKAYITWLSRHWSRMVRSADFDRIAYHAHEGIFNSIVERDPDAAEQALQDHLKVSWGHVRGTFNNSPFAG